MDLQKYKFTCPSCNQELNTGNDIVLNTKRENGDKGEIHLAISVGNYSYKHLPDATFLHGEVVDFICPKCEKNLASKKYRKFALLNMDIGNGIEFEIIFSREAGKRKTYLVTEDGIETYHG